MAVIWEDRLGCGMTRIGEMLPQTAEALIATVASILRATVTRDNPIIECELPLDGSRFEAMIPPIVSGPVFTIRRKASQVFTFDDYVRAGIMSPGQRDALEHAVSERRNILICGGTTSGKTTLTNAVIHQIVAVASASPAGDHRGHGRASMRRAELRPATGDRHRGHAAAAQGNHAAAAGSDHRRRGPGR